MSIKRIAEATGFSMTTVNLCLNKAKGYDRISDKTRDKILSVAKDFNYVKNSYASGLSTRTSPFIGLIIPTLKNRFYGTMGEIFEEYAKEHDLIPIITLTHYDYELEKQAVFSFIQHNLSAIFFCAVSDSDGLAKICDDNNMFNICFDNIKEQGISITTNNKDSSYDLTKELIKKKDNIKPIIFIGGYSRYYTQQGRLSGFIEAHKKSGISYDAKAQVLECEYSQSSAFETLNNVIKTNGLNAGAIYFNSLVVFEGGMKALIQNGHNSEFLIGCFDYHPFLKIMNTPIIAIRQKPEDMIKQAFKYFEEKSTPPTEKILIEVGTELIHL